MLNEFKNTSLNNYFMKPTIMDNGLVLYPINIYDYEYFRQLAMEYIVLDIASKNNSARQQFMINKNEGLIPKDEKYKKIQFINLFDLLVAMINQDEKIKEIKEDPIGTNEMKEKFKDDLQVIKFIRIAEQSQYQNILNNILDLFYMTTKVIPMFNGQEFVFKYDDKQIKIDRENFYEFRDIVMTQNILFEPRIAPDLESQKAIDSELKKKNGNDEFDLEAVVAFVSVNCGVDASNYTYYRLMSDYITKLKTINYEGVSTYRANGCKTEGDKDIEYPNIAEHLSIKDNPYSKDKLYKSSALTEFDRQLMKK